VEIFFLTRFKKKSLRNTCRVRC